MRTIEQELLVKEQRVSYWEKFGSVPNIKELDVFGDFSMEVGV